MALATVVQFGPKKFDIFRAPPPLKCPELWIVPPQNHFVPHHINNRYINSYYFRFHLKGMFMLPEIEASNLYILGVVSIFLEHLLGNECAIFVLCHLLRKQLSL